MNNIFGKVRDIMKNNFWFIVACVLVFFVGYNVNDVAVSIPRYKVAVVDVPTILSKSSEMQTLKISQDKKMEELNTLISKAQNEIVNESDRNKALQKEATYRKQIESQKQQMEEEYNSKITKITNKIRTLISNEAKHENYNLVLPTGMVISGGEDITEQVVKKLHFFAYSIKLAALYELLTNGPIWECLIPTDVASFFNSSYSSGL